MLSKIFDWLKNRKITDSCIGKDVEIGEFCTVKHSSLGDRTRLLERISLKRVTVGQKCLINSGTYIENADLGNDVLVAPNCSIVGVTHDFSKEGGVNHENVFKKILIGDGAWIGAGCVVMPGIIIGKGSIVGAGAVVNRDVPDFHVYVGTPSNYKLYLIKK